MKGNPNTSSLSMFCHSCERYRPLIFFPAFSDSRNAKCNACGTVRKKGTYRRDHKLRVYQIYKEHKLAQLEPLNYTLSQLRHFCLVINRKKFGKLYEIWSLCTGMPEKQVTVIKKNKRLPFTLTNLHVTRQGKAPNDPYAI